MHQLSNFCHHRRLQLIIRTEKSTSALIILQTLRALMHPWRNNYLYQDTPCRILTYVAFIRRPSRSPKGILVYCTTWNKISRIPCPRSTVYL